MPPVCCAAGPGATIRAFARSADRLRLNPDFRNDNVGFRVLCASPIFDH